MAIEDEFQQSLTEIRDHLEVTAQDISLHTALNLIPGVGSPISASISGIAQRRVYERILALFETIKEEVARVGLEAVHQEYFQTEEFQTLLGLALEQLQTTHDKKKLRLLGCALAHGGFKAFDPENRKELFLRSLRDLSQSHIQLMAELLPDFDRFPQLSRQEHLSQRRPRESRYFGETVTMLQHLVALGFVEQRTKAKELNRMQPRLSNTWTRSEFLTRLIEALEQPYESDYQISILGADFLAYLGIMDPPAQFQFRPQPQ